MKLQTWKHQYNQIKHYMYREFGIVLRKNRFRTTIARFDFVYHKKQQYILWWSKKRLYSFVHILHEFYHGLEHEIIWNDRDCSEDVYKIIDNTYDDPDKSDCFADIFMQYVLGYSIQETMDDYIEGFFERTHITFKQLETVMDYCINEEDTKKFIRFLENIKVIE